MRPTALALLASLMLPAVGRAAPAPPAPMPARVPASVPAWLACTVDADCTLVRGGDLCREGAANRTQVGRFREEVSRSCPILPKRLAPGAVASCVEGMCAAITN